MALALSMPGFVAGSLGQCCADAGWSPERGDGWLDMPGEYRAVKVPLPANESGLLPIGDATRIQPSLAIAAIQSPRSIVENGQPAPTSWNHSEALECLSLNVYWEARNQSAAGQIAVAQVTLNRARDSRYPSDVCEVVYDHKQFSWYWDGKSDWPVEHRAWEESRLIASAALDGTGHADLQGVTHYHAVYAQPYWRDSMTQVTIIGDHIFYLDSPRPGGVSAN